MTGVFTDRGHSDTEVHTGACHMRLCGDGGSGTEDAKGHEDCQQHAEARREA